MKASTSTRIAIVIFFALVVGSVAAILWIRRERADKPTAAVVHQTAIPTPSPPVEITPSPAPTATVEIPQLEPGLSPTPAAIDQPRESFVGQVNLVIPVLGVKPEQLLDTYADARSEGRSHDAIDIPAPAGTPVVAAIEGEIVKLFLSDKGGITIYQLSPDKKLVFYYAHLQRYADGIHEGKYLRQSEVIGYVGDTGNAGAGNYHLHFSIATITDPKRHWDGTNINPYPLLKRQ
ncbi:MAG TPA: peptidoglycan DD-metalloendopeptidase family protein [Pyrinomonadaceae bacterium]|nr:peptidoglycan DD-metalloendopeptidase family protein [Pyrinomonadaceae bacterium]